MTPEQTEAVIGLDTYVDEYGKEKAGNDGKKGPDLTKPLPQAELDDWKLTVPFTSGSVQILCCPEDRKCEACSNGDSNGNTVESSKPLCEECELPMCERCWHDLQGSKRPALALANDLWTGACRAGAQG